MNKLSVIQRYSEVTHFDFISFIQSVQNFYKNEFEQIKKFFNKELDVLPGNYLQKFNELKRSYQLASGYFNRLVSSEENKVTVEHFELSNILNEIESILSYIENIPKWLKASRDNIFVINVPTFEYSPEQYDTLESIAIKFYGDVSRWVDIARDNDLRYTDVGGADWTNKKLKVPLKQVRLNDIICVIDAPIGDYMLGLDIDKDFEFVDDDIKVLTGEQTFEQACNIMFELAKGDIPQYPNVGHVVSQLVSANLGILTRSNIVNEVKKVFYSDPTVKNINILKISVDEDAVNIDYNIKSITNKFFEKRNKSIQV